MNELLSCPFCGGEAMLRQGITYAAVRCISCNSKGQTCSGPDYAGKACDAWNRRGDGP